MAEQDDKTPEKRPFVPFKGAEDGTPFTSENQPTPEAKSQGWKEKRAQRLLTQAIIAKMTEGKNLDEYVESLQKNAIAGNAKAIETLNRGMEDEITKVAAVDQEGNSVAAQPIVNVYNTGPKLSSSESEID